MPSPPKARLAAKTLSHVESLALDVELAKAKLADSDLTIARCKESELRALVRIAEVDQLRYKRAMLTELENVTSTIKAYKLCMRESPRRVYYHCDCHHPHTTTGKWVFKCLEAREAWVKYPGQEWFTSESCGVMYSPVGPVTMDFSDQSVYVNPSCVILVHPLYSPSIHLYYNMYTYVHPLYMYSSIYTLYTP